MTKYNVIVRINAMTNCKVMANNKDEAIANVNSWVESEGSTGVFDKLESWKISRLVTKGKNGVKVYKAEVIVLGLINYTIEAYNRDDLERKVNAKVEDEAKYILDEINDWEFLEVKEVRTALDSYTISTLNDNGSGMVYRTREDFLDEINRMLDDCLINGGTFVDVTFDSDASFFNTDNS